MCLLLFIFVAYFLMKRKAIILLCLFLASMFPAYSQKPETGDAVPFNEVPIKPKFKGKEANEFAKWLAANIIYPQIALENGIQGRVMIQFVVNTDGSVSDVKVARGVDRNLDKEAVRVVSKSPKWTPGYLAENKPVKVLYVYPVAFSIR